MKKKTLLGILVVFFLLISLVVAVQIDESGLNDKGDKKDVDIDVNSGSLDYKETKEVELIGFEPVYKKQKYDREYCNYSMINETNVSNCWTEELEKDVVDDSKTGDKKLKYGKTKAIKYNGKNYIFDKYKGWVCGDYFCFLTNNDGGSNIEHRADEFKCDTNNKCVIRSGETGGYKNLITDEITYVNGGASNVEIQ